MHRAFALVVVVAAGCGTPRASAPVTPAIRPPALAPPAAIDRRTPGAAYLSAIAQQLQPRWAQFLEDCRQRLAPGDPLNTPTLSATAELVIDRVGVIDEIRIATSGNADFDLAVRDVLAEVPHVASPPGELLSDDDRLHLRWLFARDRRQAGPATASIVTVALPVRAVTARLLAQGELPRAARRVVAAPPGDPDRPAAAELVMIAALREALAGSVAARTAALDAIGRARVVALAEEVRGHLSPTTDTEVRLVAMSTVAALADAAAIDVLAAQLAIDLRGDPRLAVAETAALVALGQQARASAAIRRVLEADPARPSVAALHAHALAPTAALGSRLTTWFARGDARRRAAVCAAVPRHREAAPGDPAPRAPATVPRSSEAVILGRGLRDPDARVRAACADAAARQGPGRVPAATVRRLRELRRDRDRLVRARAVAALAVIEPVPVAAGDEAGEGAADPAPEVRAAAVARVTDEDELARLAHDPAPEVATAALVQLATLRGRAAMTTPLLTQLAVAPAGSVERVRIALAWLLAR